MVERNRHGSEAISRRDFLKKGAKIAAGLVGAGVVGKLGYDALIDHPEKPPKSVGLNDLLRHPEQYLGKSVQVEGFSAFLGQGEPDFDNPDDVKLAAYGLFGGMPLTHEHESLDSIPENKGKYFEIFHEKRVGDILKNPKSYTKERESLDGKWVSVVGKVSLIKKPTLNESGEVSGPAEDRYYLKFKSATPINPPKR